MYISIHYIIQCCIYIYITDIIDKPKQESKREKTTSETSLNRQKPVMMQVGVK